MVIDFHFKIVYTLYITNEKDNLSGRLICLKGLFYYFVLYRYYNCRLFILYLNSFMESVYSLISLVFKSAEYLYSFGTSNLSNFPIFIKCSIKQ